jgi:hypothetical protein
VTKVPFTVPSAHTRNEAKLMLGAATSCAARMSFEGARRAWMCPGMRGTGQPRQCVCQS